MSTRSREKKVMGQKGQRAKRSRVNNVTCKKVKGLKGQGSKRTWGKKVMGQKR